MRNPRRWRNVSVAFLATAPVALALPWLLPPEAAGDGLRGALFCYGLMVLVFGGYAFFSLHRDLRAKDALARGEGVLARWRLDPAAWADFLAHERHLRQHDGDRCNEVVPGTEVAPDGVEIIVGEEAVQVNGHIHRVPLRGTPEVLGAELRDNGVAPATIELQLKYPGARTHSSGGISPPTYTRLRFPLPGPAWREARQVVAHFNRDLPGKADFFHGRGDGSDPEDLSTCWSCGFQTHKYRSECERCGAGLLSRRWSRRFGGVLTLCGLFITAVMGTVLYFTLPMLMNPGVSYGGTRFSGSPAVAFGVLLVLGSVFAFGATALGYGLWQMATGKRNLAVAKLMMAIVGGLLLVAWLL